METAGTDIVPAVFIYGIAATYFFRTGGKG